MIRAGGIDAETMQGFARTVMSRKISILILSVLSIGIYIGTAAKGALLDDADASHALVSREMLTREVWKELSRATPLDNVIDVHITRLRKKVDQDFHKKLIHTVRGVGFVLREGEP